MGLKCKGTRIDQNPGAGQTKNGTGFLERPGKEKIPDNKKTSENVVGDSFRDSYRGARHHLRLGAWLRWCCHGIGLQATDLYTRGWEERRLVGFLRKT